MKRIKWIKLSGISLLLGALSGCASEEDSIQMAPLPQVESEFVSELLWKGKVGNGVERYFSRLTPAYAYEKVFVADRKGTVQGIDADTGKVLWETNLGELKPALISGGVTASYGKLYLGTETGKLIALEEETGERVWEANVRGEILSKPLADEGLIVINSSKGELSAYDAETGEMRWRNASEVPSLTLRGDSSPISFSGGVFWGMANGRLGAAFLKNGNIIWQQPLATPKGATEIDRLVDIDATPIVSNSLLYAVGYNGQLVAIDLRSGRPAWKRPYSASSDFFVSGDRVFIITDKDHIVAVDARSGTELWKNSELEYRQLTAPVVISERLLVGDAQGYLHWLNPENGEFVAQERINRSGIAIAPIRVEDAYVVIMRNGDVLKQKTP